MKKIIVLLILLVLVSTLIPSSKVYANEDILYAHVCLEPTKNGFISALHFGISSNEFGVRNPYALGGIVSFDIKGQGNPKITDFQLPEYGPKSYIIPEDFWSSWGAEYFKLKDRPLTL